MNVRRTRVKVCGITRVEDALHAAAAGADAIGLMLYEGSPRFVSDATAAGIVKALPPFVSAVGVFVNAPLERVRRCALTLGLTAVQLHGDETPAYCAGLQGIQRIKAVRVKSPETLAELAAFDVEAWLLDSFVPGQHGGTGVRFNWDLARQAVGTGRPVLLAGGLTPANAAEAVSRVGPWALDVSSGVESAPGIKDPAKVTAFLEAVRPPDSLP